MLNTGRLKHLYESQQFDILQEVLLEYIREHFVETSVKRDDEFNTIWEMAYSEGGKYHVNNLIKYIETKIEQGNG